MLDSPLYAKPKTYVPAYGPSPNKIMFIGEAPGQTEVAQGIPFVGSSGKELKSMCKLADIDLDSCYRTNVFPYRPKDNLLANFTIDKPTLNSYLKEIDVDPRYFPTRFSVPITPGRYLHPKLYRQVKRLHGEILQVQPNIIVTLGNTATWAVTGIQPQIKKLRGTIIETWIDGRAFKVLPTYHPAYVLRAYKERMVVVMDLLKAAKGSISHKHLRPNRVIHVAPDVEDLDWIEKELMEAPWLAIDVENPKSIKSPHKGLSSKILTCVGFATNEQNAYVIPFWHPDRPGSHYWQDPEHERRAIKLVKRVCESKIPKIMQNGLYDFQILWHELRIIVKNWTYDTMVRFHAMYPELAKSLDFMGSVYTDEIAWKTQRPRGLGTEKREE